MSFSDKLSKSIVLLFLVFDVLLLLEDLETRDRCETDLDEQDLAEPEGSQGGSSVLVLW